MKRVIPILFTIVLQVSLNAFEGGGMFSSSFNFDIGTPKRDSNPTYFSNSNRLTLWMKQNMDKDGIYNFSAQGSAYLKIRKLIAPNGKKALLKIPLDIDVFKFSFFFPLEKQGSLELDVGRRGLVDSTGVIVSQSLDGVFLKYKTPRLEVMTSLAFTTLLNANTVVLNESSYKTRNSVYALPKSYASLMFFFHVPIPKTSYSLDFDTLNFFETKKNGKMKLYLTSAIKGPIIRRLFFSLSVSASFVKDSNKWKSGAQMTGAVGYYFQKYNAKLGFNIQYASGGKHAFQTFTLRHISPQFFSPYTDVWSTGVRASIKPVPELYLQAFTNIVCRGQTQNGSLFRGVEWCTSLNYTLRRDISFEASLGQFIKKDSSVQTFLGLKGVVAF